jgi:excisionase family DNA binding protein
VASLARGRRLSEGREAGLHAARRQRASGPPRHDQRSTDVAVFSCLCPFGPVDILGRLNPGHAVHDALPCPCRSSRTRLMLTVQEAADHVRLTQWAIYRAIQRGDLAAFKPGGRLRIYEADLKAWLESTRVASKQRRPSGSARVASASAMDGALRSRPPADSLRARVRARRDRQATA